DVGSPDYLAPFLGFFGDQFPKFSGREREHVATQVGKARLDLGIGEAGVGSLLGLLMISAGGFLGAPTPLPADSPYPGPKWPKSRVAAVLAALNGLDLSAKCVAPAPAAWTFLEPCASWHILHPVEFWEPQDLHLTILSQTGRSISGPCFDLILRSAFFAARLMSAAERLSIRLASLHTFGLIC